MSFLKINNLMGKVYGTMYAVIWMGTSALTAVDNLANNDLVKFMMEFCFHPDTRIQRADGSFVEISKIQIGDILAPIPNNPKPTVTSVFRFDGTKTPLVTIGDVRVSNSHYVEHIQQMIHAEDHPDAVSIPPTSTLICLNVSGHRFGIGEQHLVVADYDEHESDHVQEATQTVANQALNGKHTKQVYVSDYNLGIDKEYEVKMSDGSWTPISNVEIGSSVWNSGKVLGKVAEQGSVQRSLDKGISMAPAQLCYNLKTEQWERIETMLGKTEFFDTILYSLITERCSTLCVRLAGKEHFIRDYREVPLPEMEDAYDAEFLV
jgi:hypothetical protein